MEKLSPEDISRAREWREKNVYRLKAGVKTWPLTADEFDDYLAAYSAAENERLANSLTSFCETHKPVDGERIVGRPCCRVKKAEAERDRLKGALRDMVVIAQQDDWHNALTGRQIVLEAAEAALRPEGE